MQKFLSWGGGLLSKGANFPPLQTNAENQPHHFPQVVGPTLSPDPTPQLHTPAYNV
jgi:hypothetical protein